MANRGSSEPGDETEGEEVGNLVQMRNQIVIDRRRQCGFESNRANYCDKQ